MARAKEGRRTWTKVTDTGDLNLAVGLRKSQQNSWLRSRVQSQRCKSNCPSPGWRRVPLIPALCVVEASLVYVVRSRTARTTKKDRVSEQTETSRPILAQAVWGLVVKILWSWPEAEGVALSKKLRSWLLIFQEVACCWREKRKTVLWVAHLG